MNIRIIIFITIFIGVLSFIHNTANAECAVDSVGTVYCSKYPTGGAITDNIGTVKCGKGQCRRDIIGSVKCSRIEGGGAAVDSIGTVKCLGGCESGKSSMCVKGK